MQLNSNRIFYLKNLHQEEESISIIDSVTNKTERMDPNQSQIS